MSPLQHLSFLIQCQYLLKLLFFLLMLNLNLNLHLIPTGKYTIMIPHRIARHNPRNVFLLYRILTSSTRLNYGACL